MGAAVRPLLLGLGLAALLASACESDDGVESEESDLTQSMTLRFELADGVVSLRASGKKLTCSERFEGLAGERVTCERDGEDLQVIVKADGKSVVAVRDLAGKRGYYTCTPSGDVGGLPAQMKCKATTLRPRGTGGLSSPFDSSVEGLSLPNAHWVDEGETILRGMEPRTTEQFDELRAAGVERVLIFKNATGKEGVAPEIEAWDLPEADVLHVPFQWKDLPDFETPCRQTVEALRFIRDGVEAKETVFFHCTVGEDRTGYLAALYGRLFEGALTRDAFDADMCERGYASGNPQKPGFVLGKLEDDLTPLYRSMAFLIDEGLLTAELDASVCASEPELPADFEKEPFECGVSTTLVP